MARNNASESAYRTLVADLRRGVYQPGSRLPGERALVESLGVSRTTVRQALGVLESEGLVERSAQRGWFVPRQLIGEPPSTLHSFTEMARTRGLTPSTRVLVQEVRGATFDEAEKLRIAPTSPVIEIERVRSMDAVPVCFDTVVLIHARARELETADLTDASLYTMLEDLSGVSVYRSAYSVQAASAAPHIAELLRIEAGAPVLIGREIAYTADGAPLLTGVNYYRGDAYRFEADLYRPVKG